jgi:hypothetical protein
MKEPQESYMVGYFKNVTIDKLLGNFLSGVFDEN